LLECWQVTVDGLLCGCVCGLQVDRSKDDIYFASEQSLSYLDGSLAGDYGFDPLGVSDPEGAGVFVSPQWLAYSELIHGRFAMLAVCGCVAPEVLAGVGLIPEQTGLAWFESGVIPPQGTFDNYWCDPYSLFLGELTLMGFAETRRLMDYRNPGCMGDQWFLGIEKALAGSGDPKYPGGPFFNLYSMGKTEESLKDLKFKEIKHGRLAMMAMLGIYVQAALTGVSPLQNIADHIADPFSNNILANFAMSFS